MPIVLKLSRAALLAASLGLATPVFTVFPAVAQETSAPNVSLSVEIPSVSAVDSSMSESQIKEVFTSSFFGQAENLARLTATSITIPEITIKIGANDGSENFESTAIYRDLVLTNVKDGYAEKVTVASSESVSADGTTTYGAMTEDGFDIRRTLELAGIVKGDPTAPMKPIYNSFSMAGGTHVGPMYNCSIGEIGGEKFEARPVKVQLADVIKAVQDNMSADEPPPEVIGIMVDYVGDLLRAINGGASTVGAIDCEVPGDMPVKVSIGGISTGGFKPGVYPDFKISGISVDAGALGTGGLGEMALKAIDLNPPLEALDSAKGQLDEAWFEANWRQLIPSFEGFSFSGFAVDAINPDAPESRVQAKVGSFDLSLANYVLGIPTDVSASATGIEIPLPQNTTDPQISTLLAAGLTGVNMGFDVAAAWDEASSSIALEKLAFAAVDLGSMSISADIGNATVDLFAIDPNVALNSAMGTMVKKVVINVTDDGLGEIVWPLAAAEQGQTDIEAFRTQMAGFAEGVALQLLGSTDAARQLGVSLGDFVTGRKGAVTITITSKDPNGIPLAYFMAAQEDPSILTGQIDVTGSAS